MAGEIGRLAGLGRIRAVLRLGERANDRSGRPPVLDRPGPASRRPGARAGMRYGAGARTRCACRCHRRRHRSIRADAGASAREDSARRADRPRPPGSRRHPRASLRTPPTIPARHGTLRDPPVAGQGVGSSSHARVGGGGSSPWRVVRHRPGSRSSGLERVRAPTSPSRSAGSCGRVGNAGRDRPAGPSQTTHGIRAGVRRAPGPHCHPTAILTGLPDSVDPTDDTPALRRRLHRSSRSWRLRRPTLGFARRGLDHPRRTPVVDPIRWIGDRVTPLPTATRAPLAASSTCRVIHVRHSNRRRLRRVVAERSRQIASSGRCRHLSLAWSARALPVSQRAARPAAPGSCPRVDCGDRKRPGDPRAPGGLEPLDAGRPRPPPQLPGRPDRPGSCCLGRALPNQPRPHPANLLQIKRLC